MRLTCILSPDAAKSLADWPKPLRNHVVKYLRRLAKNPAAVSRPSAFPYPPNCQLFHLPPLFLDEMRHHFVILFKYGQDEESLHIVSIGHTNST